MCSHPSVSSGDTCCCNGDLHNTCDCPSWKVTNQRSWWVGSSPAGADSRPHPLPQLTFSVVVEGDQQAGSGRGGFYGSGPGARRTGHLLLLLSHVAAALRPGRRGGCGLAVPPGGSRNRFGDQLAIYLPSVAFGSPTIHFTLPDTHRAQPPLPEGDTLKPHPLGALLAKVRASGRWQPTCWVQTCSRGPICGPDLTVHTAQHTPRIQGWASGSHHSKNSNSKKGGMEDDTQRSLVLSVEEIQPARTARDSPPPCSGEASFLHPASPVFEKLPRLCLWPWREVLPSSCPPWPSLKWVLVKCPSWGPMVLAAHFLLLHVWGPKGSSSQGNYTPCSFLDRRVKRLFPCFSDSLPVSEFSRDYSEGI